VQLIIVTTGRNKRYKYGLPAESSYKQPTKHSNSILVILTKKSDAKKARKL